MIPSRTIAYPFMKRITNWPQAWLGFCLATGVAVGWTIVTGTLERWDIVAAMMLGGTT